MPCEDDMVHGLRQEVRPQKLVVEQIMEAVCVLELLDESGS